MRHLIQHLLSNNMSTILQHSLFNCHVRGLHSIMLINSPGQTVRMFVATSTNELDKNRMLNVLTNKTQMSLAFHPHHCNLTLHCVAGELFNWTVKENELGDITMGKYKYSSAITGEGMGFTLVDKEVHLSTVSAATRGIKAGQSMILQAKDIHTVSTPVNEMSAWLVYEGAEDENYTSFAYANHDISKLSQHGLYQKPSLPEVVSLVQTVLLQMY